MKRKLLCNLFSLFIAGFFLINTAKAQSELIPTGSFIVNMGVVPQTYGNGIKPWGMLHDLIKNYRVQVRWVINPSKVKDGIDFSFNGTDYKGGTFVIPAKYRTTIVNQRIAYWQSQGVVGVTTTSSFLVNVSYNLKYSPRWTFDFQNGNIALGFLTAAGIPTAEYPKKYPANLNSCDDLFVMPHADPTWDTHSNLLNWNLSNGGWIWAGCHAVSVLENLVNPLDATQRMNFLSTNGLIMFNDHGDGTPPYSYRYPAEAEMQFMGVADGAMQNGSEQIFLPAVTSSWRASTKVAVYDPTQQNVPSSSPGEAGAIVYGRGLGDISRGKVMYTGGHNIEKGTADAVAAMRAFFNFSFLSVYDKATDPNISGPINVTSLNTYTYRVSLPEGYNPSNYSFHWTSSCGGTFSNPFDTATNFTAPAISDCTPCVLYCTITDGCGREYYQSFEINICATAPPVALDRVMKIITNPNGTTAQKIGDPVPLAGTDEDGYVTTYVLKSLPANGLLYYDNDNNISTPDISISSLSGGELVLTPAQMKSMKYDPADGFGGNTSFTYTVIDNANLRDLTPATYTIPVNPPPVAVSKICTPVASNAFTTMVCAMQANDNGSIVSYTITSLPPVSQCKVFVLDMDAYVGQVLTPAEASQLYFKPIGKYVGYSEIMYTATDNNGATDLTPATLTVQMVNQPPTTFDVVANNIASSVGNTQYAVPALAGSDEDGAIASFTLVSVCPSTQGVLYYNKSGVYTPANNNLSVNLTQASTLKFDPNETFNGTAYILYAAKDTNGLFDSTPDTLSIPVRYAVPSPNGQVLNNWYAGGGWQTVPPLTANGSVTNFIITGVPPLSDGKLGPDLNNDGKGDFKIGYDVGKGLPYTLTATEAAKLMYDPVKSFKGNSYFTFTAINALGSGNANAAVRFENINNTLPETNNVTHSVPLLHTAIATAIDNISAFDADWAIKPQDKTKEYIVITSLPAPSTGVLKLASTLIQLWDVLDINDADALTFDPATGNSDTAVFTYAYMDKCLDTDPTPATYKIPIIGPANISPVSVDTTMTPISVKAGVMNRLIPLNGTDVDGTVVSYKIMQGFNPNEGTLYLDDVPITNNQVIPKDKGDDLYVVPTGLLAGTFYLKYKSVDNKGAFSSQTYLYIPAINNAPVASNISITGFKKGLTTKIPALMATDIEGTINSYTVVTLPVLGTLQCDINGTNSFSNVVVNQVLTPAQSDRLRIITGNVTGNTSFTYFATDNTLANSNIATYTIPVLANDVNMAPVAKPITSVPINANAGQTLVSPIVTSDIDGSIISYTIATIPPAFYGKLYYNSSGSIYDSIIYGNQVLTPAQAATLKFKPSGIYSGKITFTYTSTDNEGATSNFASYILTVNNLDPVAANLNNNPVSSNSGPVLLNTLSATDESGIRSFIIKSIPSSSEGTLVMDGSPVTAEQVIPVLYANRLEFDPNPAYSGTASFTYTVQDDYGAIDMSYATVTIPVTNFLPQAIENNSQVITNTAGTITQAIPSLLGKDPDGTIASFTLLTLPANGKLYLNGAAINSLPGGGMVLSPLQATQLSFDPNDNFNSVTSFTFTVKDNDNNIAATPAVYTIYSNVPPATQNIQNLGMFANQAATAISPLIASDDISVDFYSIMTLPDPAAGTLYINNVAVTSLSQVSNLSQAQVSQLLFSTTAKFNGAIFTYTASDNMGIIDVTPAVYRIPFGAASTLPVELTIFAGIKSGNDNQLNWTTDQEINSDRFELERSNDGVRFVKITTVNARGNTTTKTNYAYTDKNVSGNIQYYRLKMVDIDGTSAFSRIVVIKRDKLGLDITSVSPNPFVDKLSVDISSETNGPAQLQIFNLSGTMVRSTQIKTVKGTNHYDLDKLEGLSSGIYIISIRSSEGISKTKLYKSN